VLLLVLATGYSATVSTGATGYSNTVATGATGYSAIVATGATVDTDATELQ
jgi:hypothetical protein